MEISSSLVLLLILAVLMLVIWWRTVSGHSLPPGPLALPLIGNLHVMDNRAPYKSFTKVRETYMRIFFLYFIFHNHVQTQLIVKLLGVMQM